MVDRRLPVYLLVETSAFMKGELIDKVKTAIGNLVEGLCEDPCARDTAWISVITFGAEPRQIVPLTPICEFVMPELVLGGKSALGSALSLLCECRMCETVEGTIEQKGDFRPIVFCFENGCQVVGDLERGVCDLMGRKWWKFICITAGADVNNSCLKHIHPSGLFSLQDLQDRTLVKCFGWIIGGENSWPPHSSRKKQEVVSDVSNLEGDIPPPPDFVIL